MVRSVHTVERIRRMHSTMNVVGSWPTHRNSPLIVAEDGEITEERFFYELVGLIRQIGLA